MTLHHYVIVRSDLPLGVLAAQVIHAAGESVVTQVPSGTHAVALSVPDETSLERVEDLLIRNDVPHVPIREPDAPWNGSLMAIGVRPMAASTPNLRTAVKRLRLLKERT